MPNGDVGGGGGFVSLPVTIGRLIGSLFGGGGGVQPGQPSFFGGLIETLLPSPLDPGIGILPEELRDIPEPAGEPEPIGIPIPFVPVSQITGRAPIPTPAEGGPPLVTERFSELPGPLIPEPDVLRFPPEPDVLFQQEEDMAVDAPMLRSSLLPALRQATTPAVTGFLGGLAQDVVSGFLRAPQELGVGQIPARVATAGRLCPPERPSTRILRQIQMSTGVRVKLSSAKALIRQLGLQNGARCLGISVTDACTLIITASPRRRRGISGSDIRIVKRTARRFQSLQEDLSGLVSRRRAAPRRRQRHVHALPHTHTA